MNRTRVARAAGAASTLLAAVAMLSACSATSDASNAGRSASAVDGQPPDGQADGGGSERSDQDLCGNEIAEWADPESPLMTLTAAEASYDPDTTVLLFERRVSETRELAAEVDEADLRSKIEAAADATQALSDGADDLLGQAEWLALQRPVLEAELAVLTHCYTAYGETEGTATESSN